MSKELERNLRATVAFHVREVGESLRETREEKSRRRSTRRGQERRLRSAHKADPGGGVSGRVRPRSSADSW